MSLYISHLLQFHISNCCCSGVHEMHLGILLRRFETDCLAIAVPSLAFKAMSPQCLLNLFSVTSMSPQGPARSPQPILRLRPSSSICFLCRSTVILLLSATIISLRPLIRQLLSVSLLFFPGQEQLVAGLAQCPRSLPANCRLLHIISPQVALPPCYT